MEKVEIKRLIVSILLFILSTSCAVIGIMKYYDGYGKYGKIRKELMPIINEFNNSQVIKNSSDSILAEFNNDSIRISYVNATTNLKYDYKYTGQNDVKYLTLSYKKNESDYVEKISKELIEAISICNGNSYGDVFKTYQYTDFYTTTLLDGISISKSGLDITLEIAINIDIIDSLKDKFINTDNTAKYITSLDLRNLIPDLETKGSYSLTKDTVNLYVISKDGNYVLYINEKSNNKDKIYESIMSTIYILNNKLYNDIFNNKEKFDSDTDNYYYKINTKAEPIENVKGKNIIEVTIKNKSN